MLIGRLGISLDLEETGHAAVLDGDREIPLLLEARSADEAGAFLLEAERQGFSGAALVPSHAGGWMIAFLGKAQGSAVLTPAMASLPAGAGESAVFLGALVLYGAGVVPSVLAAADWLRAVCMNGERQ